MIESEKYSVSFMSKETCPRESDILSLKGLWPNLSLQVDLLPTLDHISVAVTCTGDHLGMCSAFINLWTIRPSGTLPFSLLVF